MRDLLVRYLLGELDAREREQLEAELHKSPELRRELSYLRACLPDEPKPPAAEGPPRDLASRTLERIACGDTCPPSDDACRALADVEPPTGSARWSLADMTAAAGMFLAVGMLFLPAVRQSRDAARRTECANNLRQLGTILIQYSEDHGGFFPVVGRDDNAGIFAMHLVHERYATPEELQRLLVCRSSELGERVANGQDTVRLPCRKSMASACANQLAEMRRTMSGSYAYRIGYIAGDRYYGIRNERSPRAPLLSDSPSYLMANLQSANHGGCGQNMLMQDGSVGYQRTSMLLAPHGEDQIFLNDVNVPEAGHGKFDTVLMRSDATPGLVPPQSVP
jgi:hypothetical protein